MELIQKWLSGSKNFIVGSVLYNKFGTDAEFKKLLKSKPDAYLQKRLEEELSKLLEKPKVVLQQALKVSDAVEMPETSEPVLKALRLEWLPLYQRMNYLRHELDKFEGNSEEAISKRRQIAFEVLELEQQCNQVWDRYRFYQEKGKLPEVKKKEEPLPEDPIELGKLIESIKRNIRRNKQLTDKNPDNPSYPQKVKLYEEKLHNILNQQSDGKVKG